MNMKQQLLFSGVSGVAISIGFMAGAATIDSWDLGNVVVGATDGTASASVVYNGDPVSPTSSGQIAYAPPEALAPGIKVVQETYTQGGSAGGGLTLDGCIMTSNPTNTCTGEFQSGKRIKTQMTGFDPVDLVFNLLDGDESNYQVFYRLINQTTQSLTGFAIELGFGIGDAFVQATAMDGIGFSFDFRAQPADAGASSTTQFPFGLFGEAASNPNFSLDGFFAPERTSLSLEQTEATITSTGFVGPYTSLFDAWLSQEDVPLGAFWDNDSNPETDALLMAWLNADNEWELRRGVADFGLGLASTLSEPQIFGSFADVVAVLGLEGSLFQDDIEDLANLNVNFAINLRAGLPTFNGDTMSTFTMRTTVFPSADVPAAVPLPASAPLLAGGLAFLGFFARRKLRKAA